MSVNVPLYTEPDYGNMRPLSLRDWTPAVWDSMRFSFGEAWRSNPTTSMQQWADTNPGQAQGTVFSGMDDFAAAGIAGVVRDVDMEATALPAFSGNPDDRRAMYEDAARRAAGRGYARKEIRRASLDRQRELIAEAGLTGAIQPHENYTEDALKVILDGKKQQRAAQFVAEKSPGWHLPFSLAAGLAASLLDPANIVAGLVPTIGEQRMASLLAANARSAWGRAGARATQGAASGALGAALVEPVVYAGQQSMQADYDMYMSLVNVGMGAAMGAAIMPAAGAVREFLNIRRGIAMPWQIERATPQSEALRNGAVEMLERARLAARPDQDAASVHAQAVDDIFLLDDHLRRRALAENMTAEEAWQRYAPDFKSGERFRVEAGRLERSAQAMRKEMDELEARRAMLEQFPEMRQAADDLDALSLRVEMTEAKAREARRAHAALMDELAGAETYYKAENNTGAVNRNIPQSQSVSPDSESLSQLAPDSAIMGAATFRQGRRAEINLFRAHDHTTAIHEIGHAVLRDLEEMAALPGMATHVRKQVQALRRKYNVPEGEAWSRQAREAFAGDFARFAKGDDAPPQSVATAFVMLRERALDRYAEADAAGVQISRAARDVFNGMLSLPVERGQREFQNAVADVLTRRWEQEFLPADPHRKPGDAAGLAGDPSVAARELEGGRAGQSHFDPGDIAEADPRNAEMLSRIVDSDGQALEMELARDGIVPAEIREGIRAERDAELAGIRRELDDIPNQEKDMAEYLSCILAGG